MKLYLVRNKDGNYLYIQYHHLVFWGPKDKASVYHTWERAREAGNYTFDWDDDATEHFDIVEIDTDVALEVLRDLFEVDDLGDHIYAIREREGKGWEGPLVLKWAGAVDRAKKLLKEGVE